MIVRISAETQAIEPDQGDSPLSGPFGNKGCPNIRRKRLPGWSLSSCFLDSFRSLSVKGRASCAISFGDEGRRDGCLAPCPEVEVGLSAGVSIH